MNSPERFATATDADRKEAGPVCGGDGTRAWVTVSVIVGPASSRCLAIGNLRVAGPKPWGGGTVLFSWDADIDELEKAVAHARAATNRLNEIAASSRKASLPSEGDASLKAGEESR